MSATSTVAFLRPSSCLRCWFAVRSAANTLAPPRRSPSPWIVRSFTNAGRRLAKPPTPAPRGARTSPTPKTSLPGSISRPGNLSASRWEQLFASGDRVLLFKSANHTSFFIHSYIIGGFLVFGAYNYAAVVSQPLPGEDTPRPLPIWVKAMVYGSAAFVAVFGTVVLMAPLRLLKTVTAVAKRTPGSSVIRPYLVCEIKAPLPLMQVKTIEVPASEAFMNRKLSHTQLDYTHVPMSMAGKFTSDYLGQGRKATAQTEQSKGIGQSLLNFWPNLKHETRRLILRDGFASLRFEGRGSFKVDLHGCELLDHGRPFGLLTSPVAEGGTGSFAAVRRWLSS